MKKIIGGIAFLGMIIGALPVLAQDEGKQLFQVEEEVVSKRGCMDCSCKELILDPTLLFKDKSHIALKHQKNNVYISELTLEEKQHILVVLKYLPQPLAQQKETVKGEYRK
ncbi:hypothetical protein [Algivirga pacifica]|uniref:Cytochrome c domain-containing protein n=1 Tax=Algivirga pacifica TaxID=1162670 RepID=A0ABP9DBZ1_9BACT